MNLNFLQNLVVVYLLIFKSKSNFGNKLEQTFRILIELINCQ